MRPLTFRLSVLAACTLMLPVLFARPLVGQVTGLPTWNAGALRGLTLAAEVGAPNQDYGDGTAYGIRVGFGRGRLNLQGVLSRYDVAEPFANQTGLGIAAGWRLGGRPMMGPSATVQAGAEFFALDDGSKLRFPIGVGLGAGFRISRFLLRPWIAPRLDIFRNSFDSPTHTETDFGLSGGMLLMSHRGFGLSLAADRTFAGNGFNPSTISIGVLYGLSLSRSQRR